MLLTFLYADEGNSQYLVNSINETRHSRFPLNIRAIHAKPDADNYEGHNMHWTFH